MNRNILLSILNAIHDQTLALGTCVICGDLRVEVKEKGVIQIISPDLIVTLTPDPAS